MMYGVNKIQCERKQVRDNKCEIYEVNCVEDKRRKISGRAFRQLIATTIFL